MDSSEEQPTSSPTQQPTAPPTRIQFRVAALLAVVWYLCLASLAVFTANPVTLNARQILDSRWIVLATIDNDGVVHERKSIRGLLPDGPIKLTDPCRYPNQEVILPLVREFGDFRVTPTHLPKGDRLIYPATEAALQQLDEILNAPAKAASK
jgi:hypothetical protein